MNSLITLISILTPLFLGFFIRVPKRWLPLVDKGLGWLVYLILLLIGVSLSQVENLGAQMQTIISATVLLFVCVIGLNLLVLMWFDRRYPWQVTGNGKKANVSIRGSLKQVGCVLLGFLAGNALPAAWLPSENLGTYCLMLLVLLVGVQLRSSGITLRQVLINKRGVQTCVLITLSSLAGGLLFAALMPQVSWSKGLALASGFGWYSLSGIVMTEAYGPVWGSIALLNDLAREFFALVFIPLLMRGHPSAAVGVGGATSLDFTLPVIQSSGGLAAVPLAISFGFVINVLAPVLMVVFSAMHF
ncbi:lysine exporter LysO family protein [Uruburuella testudinis]|uniref:Lysine exporter LysO family protein n=1 Tax=Uruburuella testudinis TaxID=1282863 RepID=A0ABY4DV11_9NEIS|nr:lysine exporter LysO family protein [Uruburuella testudinis]UOO82879.1 lysine exporter LysO family protein [Uruburuella testudinis]